MSQQQQQQQQQGSDPQRPCPIPPDMPCPRPSLPAPQSGPSSVAPQTTPSRPAPQPGPSRPSPQSGPSSVAPQSTPSRPAPQPGPSRPSPQPGPSHAAPQPGPSHPSPQPGPSHAASQPGPSRPSPPQPGPSRLAPPAVTYMEVICSPMVNLDVEAPGVRFGVHSFNPEKPSDNFVIPPGMGILKNKQLYKEKRHEDIADQGHAANKHPKVNEEPQQATGPVSLDVSGITCKEILVDGRKGMLVTVNWSNASGNSTSSEKTTTDAAVQTTGELENIEKPDSTQEQPNTQPTAEDVDADADADGEGSEGGH